MKKLLLITTVFGASLAPLYSFGSAVEGQTAQERFTNALQTNNSATVVRAFADLSPELRTTQSPYYIPFARFIRQNKPTAEGALLEIQALFNDRRHPISKWILDDNAIDLDDQLDALSAEQTHPSPAQDDPIYEPSPLLDDAISRPVAYDDSNYYSSILFEPIRRDISGRVLQADQQTPMVDARRSREPLKQKAAHALIDALVNRASSPRDIPVYLQTDIINLLIHRIFDRTMHPATAIKITNLMQSTSEPHSSASYQLARAFYNEVLKKQTASTNLKFRYPKDFLPYLGKVSVQDYIDRGQVPAVKNGVLYLDGFILSSLEGIENLRSFKTIRTLSLRDNNFGNGDINKLFDDLSKLANLRKLSLNNNDITTLPDFANNGFKRLEELHLANNRLTQLPESIGLLENLVNLDVSKNRLTFLPKNLQLLSNLKKLDLNTNYLQEFPIDITLLDTLVYLNFQKNELRTIPSAIGNLKHLAELYLDTNRLTILPDSIGELTSLKIIGLSDNLLTTIPCTIGNLRTLTNVHLDGNRLTSLPDSIGNLSNVYQLDLRHNRLTTLPETITGLTNISCVTLGKNLFSQEECKRIETILRKSSQKKKVGVRYF